MKIEALAPCLAYCLKGSNWTHPSSSLVSLFCFFKENLVMGLNNEAKKSDDSDVLDGKH